jgi:hypothetical protein
MDEALQRWRQRHAVDDNAYRELVSILEASKLPESSPNSANMLLETLHFAPGSWNRPSNLQIDTPSFSAHCQIDYNLQLEAFTEPNSTSDWLANDSAPINHGFNLLNGDGQPLQDMESTPPFSEEMLPFCSSNVWTNPLPAHVAPLLSEPEQKEPSCIRCWKWKKAV